MSFKEKINLKKHIGLYKEYFAMFKNLKFKELKLSNLYKAYDGEVLPESTRISFSEYSLILGTGSLITLIILVAVALVSFIGAMLSPYGIFLMPVFSLGIPLILLDAGFTALLFHFYKKFSSPDYVMKKNFADGVFLFFGFMVTSAIFTILKAIFTFSLSAIISSLIGLIVPALMFIYSAPSIKVMIDRSNYLKAKKAETAPVAQPVAQVEEVSQETPVAQAVPVVPVVETVQGTSPEAASTENTVV